MRRIMMIILSAILTMGMMAGCANDTPETTAPEKTELTTTVPEQETVTEPVETTELVTEEVTLTDGTNFSEGIAWVRYIDPVGRHFYGLINSSGKVYTSTCVIAACADAESYGSAFSGGYSYINVNDGFLIFDTEGNATAQIFDDKSQYQILVGGDGVYLVRQDISNFQTNETRYGFIDANGNWIQEPTADHLFAWEHSAPKYYYLGEYVFATSFGELINSDTLECHKLECGSDMYLTDEYHNAVRFENGETIFFVSDYSDCYISKLDTKGNFKSLIEIDGTDWRINYSEGLFFTGTYNITRTSSGANVFCAKDGGFYNMYGERVIDFSEYTALVGDAEGFFEFKNGIAAVKLLGADKGVYICHINKDGEFLYDPVQISSAGNYVGHSSAGDSAIYITSSENYNDGLLLKNDGTIIDVSFRLGASELSEFVFCCGYAWNAEDCCYVNEDGDILAAYVVKE